MRALKLRKVMYRSLICSSKVQDSKGAERACGSAACSSQQRALTVCAYVKISPRMCALQQHYKGCSPRSAFQHGDKLQTSHNPHQVVPLLPPSTPPHPSPCGNA
jgi:hypothetical protein